MHKFKLFSRVIRLLILAGAVLATQGKSIAQHLPDDKINEAAPDSFLVVFETTKGSFEVKARRDWSPLAVDRFYHLVRLGFFDDIALFRVVSGFVAQFGIHNNEKVNEAWKNLGIEDEPAKVSNRRGTISFARGGPKSRTTQLFINLKDNETLDKLPIQGVAGYPPFAEVVSGMEIIDAFNSEYGNEPAMFQDSIFVEGRAFLDRAFPGLDYILSAQIKKTY